MDKLKKGVKGIVDGVSKMELDDAKRKGRRFRDNLVKQMNVDSFPQDKAGLLVTEQLDLALSECKAKVESIINRCHETNRKFRDIEFDLEKDQEQCRYGLPERLEELQSRRRSNVAVKRVTEIFENPVFFGPDGPNASAVRQGQLGDCWFLAALSAIATVDSGALLKKLCVARDEEVGVYGFIFFRDCYWESIIVDDLLFWSMPKFDELKVEEKRLYHNNRESYHRVVEKSGEGLEYARSGTVGETWVPLIEKAYAKLHGDYASLEGGFLADAIEDLTGGVATSFQTSDLLSQDKFWRKELQHNELHTRLFGVSLDLDETHSQQADLDVQGLLPGHAYSVMRVRECRGKRFVIVRNPWGDSEWTGAWADGSKEWKGEWLGALQQLEHEFGNDGQFVMEYKDFMTVFSQIDRATIFDPSWSMSWHFMPIPPQPLSRLWIYGDTEFSISIDRDSSAVVVLSQMDDRYYKNLQGTEWDLDFVIFRKGDLDPSKVIAASGISLGSRRSVSCELTLSAGEYVVLPRVEAAYNFITRKRARVLNDLALAWSKVLPALERRQGTNETSDMEGIFPMQEQPSFLSSGLEDLEAASDDEDEDENEGDDKPGEKGDKAGKKGDKANNSSDDGEDDVVPDLTLPLFLGLRVYTQNKAVATVTGKLCA